MKLIPAPLPNGYRTLQPIHENDRPPLEVMDDLQLMSFLNALWMACAKEWTTMDGWRHGNARTYNEGCRGPLCKHAAREASREKNSSEPRGKYVWLDPIIAHYRHRLFVLERDNTEKLRLMYLTNTRIESIGMLMEVHEDEVSEELWALIE